MENIHCPNCQSYDVKVNTTKKQFLGYLFAAFVLGSNNKNGDNDITTWIIAGMLSLGLIWFFHYKSFTSHYCRKCKKSI